MLQITKKTDVLFVFAYKCFFLYSTATCCTYIGNTLDIWPITQVATIEYVVNYGTRTFHKMFQSHGIMVSAISLSEPACFNHGIVMKWCINLRASGHL